MSDYISRAELLKEFPVAKADPFENCRNCTCLDSETIHIIVNRVPAADVRPVVRSSWATAYVSGIEHERCCNCGTYVESTFFANDYAVNYCPNCGADMREEADHDHR